MINIDAVDELYCLTHSHYSREGGPPSFNCWAFVQVIDSVFLLTMSDRD